MKLENAAKDEAPVVLQRYTRIEYPWGRREKYKKAKNVSILERDDPTKLREGVYDLPNLHAVFPSHLMAPRDELMSAQPVEKTDKFAKIEKDLGLGLRVDESTQTLPLPGRSKGSRRRPKSAQAGFMSPFDAASTANSTALVESAQQVQDKRKPAPAPLVRQSHSHLSGLRDNRGREPKRESPAPARTTAKLRAFPTRPQNKPRRSEEDMARTVERLSKMDKKLPPIISPLEKDFLGNIIQTPKRPKSTGNVAKNCERLIGMTETFMKTSSEKAKLEAFLANGWHPHTHPTSTFPPSMLPNATSKDCERSVTVLPSEAIIRWPEMYRSRDNQHRMICVTIEHCCDCEHHMETLHHRSTKYLAVAEACQGAIATVACAYACR